MTFFRFFLFNLIGNVVPILSALVAVPLIVHYAGVDRLGALGVAWGLIGTFGFLDFGLSRVVTRRVALAVEQKRTDAEWLELRGFLWWWALPGLFVITILLIASQFAFVSHFAGGSIGQEVAHSWIWIALCIPITLIGNWFRGVLEGLQRFARVSALRTVFGTWNYMAPALAVMVWPTLSAMVAAITIGRLLALFAHAWVCLQIEPGILIGPAPHSWASCRKFFKEGGWITISNVIAPLMIYSDRFVLAALVPAEAIAWYTASQDALLRLLIIPGALVGVLFPKFSGSAESAGKAEGGALYQRSVRVIAAIMLPVCAGAALLAYDALRLWLGDSFALHSHRVVEIIAIGLFTNSIANFPLGWLQGLGRSHITARVHLIEMPLYALGLYFAISQGGIEGAAWIWTGRVSLDCVLLLWMADREACGASILIAAMGAIFVMFSGYMTGPMLDWSWRVALAGLLGMLSMAMAWFGLLNWNDRNEIGRLRHAN